VLSFFPFHEHGECGGLLLQDLGGGAETAFQTDSANETVDGMMYAYYPVL
jgi:hypothetical protein